MTIEVGALSSTQSSGGSKVRQELRHATNAVFTGQCDRVEAFTWLVECAQELGLDADTSGAEKTSMKALADLLALALV